MSKQLEKIREEDLGKLILVSNPVLLSTAKEGLFVATKINIERNRYESSIWLVNLQTGDKESLTRGICPILSKDEKKIAFLRKRKGLTELRIMKLKGEEWKVLDTKLGLSSISWSPDGKLLSTVMKLGKIEKDVKNVTNIDLWHNAEGYTYYQRRSVALIDTESGNYEIITDENERVESAEWSPDGKYIAYIRIKDLKTPYLHQLVLYNVSNGEKKVLVDDYHITELSWNPNSTKIAFKGHKLERGLATHLKVYVTDLNGNLENYTQGLELNADNGINCDVRGPSCSKTIKWGDANEVYFLVSDGGLVYLMSSQGVPIVRLKYNDKVIDEFDVKKGVILYTLMSPSEPKELYIYDGKTTKLTYFNKLFVETRELYQPDHITFTASDGVNIDGWVILPKVENGEERKIPGILYIHGGPKTSFGYSFMFEFQFLVSQGFALMYSNPRGSDGYTEEFADIRGKYGERDYQDLMEFVDYIIKRYTVIDPERLGVTGGSYGGFMTNWIITHTNRFKAAVTQRSIADWVSMYGTTDIGYWFVPDQIECTPWENLEKCIEKSPITYVKNAKTPTLIIHGLEDYRCWVDQAIAFFRALQMNDVKSKLLLFPGESHELTRSGKPKHRIRDLKEKAKWFKENLEA
ncbi:MAG: S9 family peptidase [Sulfolobaceae archaeon]|nr:S9 family peptidase [Sulfolobaceae archaeon]